MAYVISKMGAGVDYTGYRKIVDGKNIRLAQEWKISIKGGNGVMERHTLVTPDGVITQITDEQAELLKNNELFKKHERRGYIRIVGSASAAEKVGKEIEKEDNSAQLTAEDFAAEAANNLINEDDVKVAGRKVEKTATRSRKRK